LDNELSNNLPVRFAVTPDSSTSFSDFDGIYKSGSTVHTPQFGYTATSVPTETFTVANSTVTVDQTSTAVEVDVTRSGYNNDTATVSYTSNLGAGTSGTVSFGQGQTVAPISITLPGSGSQASNVNFNVTLGAATSTSVSSPILGSQVTTQVTIVGNASLTYSATEAATTSADIETTGDYTTDSTTAPVNGSPNNGTAAPLDFQSFSVLEFTPATTPGVYPTPGYVVTNGSLSNLSLTLTNSNVAGEVPGDFNIYLLADTESTTPTSGLAFNTSAAPGGLGTQGTPVLLGTFSFENTSSDIYTPASLAASTTTLLVNDLNNQTPIRFALTPGSPSFAGVFGGAGSATLSVVDQSLLTGNPETVSLNTSSAPFSVTEGGTITFEVDRSDVPGGNYNDSETINYTTANGTALAGTNYNAASGTLTFGPNVTQQFITVPTDALASQGGDKVFTLTLSNLSTNSSNAQPILGTASALVTITDTTSGNRETLTTNSSDQQSIQTTGPFNTAGGYVYATGNMSSASTYASVAVADFNDPNLSGLADSGGQNQGLDQYNPSATVTQIDSLTIGIVGSGAGVAGPVNVYLVTNANSNIDPIATSPSFNVSAFDSSGVENGVGFQFGTAMLLGQIEYSPSLPTNSYTQVPLIGYSQEAENTLIGYLNSQTKFRLVLAPGNSSVDAKIDGNYDDDGTSTVEPKAGTGVDGATNISSGKYSPTLTIVANEGTVSPLPLYVSANSQATYNPSNNTLTVTGPTTFIADPGNGSFATGAPNVVASGSSATVSFNLVSGSQVHLASLSLTGGAVATESNPAGSPLVLEVAGGLTITTGATLNIGYGDLDVSGGSLSQINALVASGYNLTGGGNWKGTGITSSAAAGDSTHLTAVGVITDPTTGTFDGDPSAAAGDVLVKYTYFGDANLSGNVDGSDYSLIDAAYAAEKAHPGTATGWMNGDFNYDGTVNGSDYALIDNAFNNQRAAVTFIPSAQAATIVAAPAETVTKPVSKTTLPSVLSNSIRHTAVPVALFKGANQLPPFFFSDTPIISGSTSTSTLAQKAKKGLADSVVDSVDGSAN
jgi:hypothetical protein